MTKKESKTNRREGGTPYICLVISDYQESDYLPRLFVLVALSCPA